MSGHDDVTLPSTRRPRKSTGNSPTRKKVEKENFTVDLASTQAGNAGRKKSRSKSIGPGGLDVLKSGSGNRRMTLAAPPKSLPKSILKPTMPQLPDIPPHKSKGSFRKSPPSGVAQGLEKLPNPFHNDDPSASGTKVALRTEEEQQAAAREREEKERAELEKEIKDRREARRKSLANRRVSFAAEATLHTFHEIEFLDSTTSTDSTRGSSLTAQATGSMSAPNPHDETMASSDFSSDASEDEGVTEIEEIAVSDSGSDSDADGVTMDLEMTGTSMASAMSPRSEGDNDTLDDMLRQASRRADTQPIDEEEEAIPFFSWVKKPAQAKPPVDDDTTAPMDMEITKAIGGIIDDELQDDPQEEEMTMDVTRSLGGILKDNAHDDDGSMLPEEDLTMEFTTAVGGVMETRRMLANIDEENMDMTVGLGRIIPAANEHIDEADATTDMDMDMEMTTAVGQILREPAVMTEDPSKEPSEENHMDQEASMIPGRSFFFKPNDPLGGSDTPQQSSPIRTPVSQRRSPSPKRSTLLPDISTPNSVSKRLFKSSIFQQDQATGLTTPRIVLTPQNRKLSGIGADRPGLGSPKVAAIFDRRGSIGDTAGPFVPRENLRVVGFADPQIIEDEVESERQQEHAKEADSNALGWDSDGDGNQGTATLKDMILSMTPKKNPLKGRKSLHVGSAMGLLGKRPAELDEDDDDDGVQDGVKRLKNHQSSPVKNIRLRAPPSKEETTGRATMSTSKTLESATGSATTPFLALSPGKASNLALSPQQPNSHIRDLAPAQSFRTSTLQDTVSALTLEGSPDKNGEQIHLQDFLNLTSIRFMELTTTKRRHTQAPNLLKDALQDSDDLSLERCIVAGACTVPMLELYQHSCRELKNYISEGRRIVREIETETFEENPPLFREYMSATPEFKALMDNQFKNVKTHARLLSKAMWYEWRMKLQDGLKEGLVQISEDMATDEKLLEDQEKLIHSALPGLVEKFESLTTEHENLKTTAEELADCDPEELQAARTELTDLDAEIEMKKRKIAELQKQLAETESSIDEATQTKEQYIAEIEEAEKVREECRGWTSNEVNALKARVDDLERRYGWAIKGVSGTVMTMTYKRELALAFDVAAFCGPNRTASPDSQMTLEYIAANRERDPQPLSPEKEFFVQLIRDHVRRLPPAQTKIKAMLRVVSGAWAKASHVTYNVRLLNCTFPTKVVRISDDAIAVRSLVLLIPLRTKLEITLTLQAQHTPTGIEVSIATKARVVYGEQFIVDKLTEYLENRIGNSLVTKEENPDVECWSSAVVELHERLVARGQK